MRTRRVPERFRWCLLAAALSLAATACGPEEGHPLVLQVKEIVGQVEIAEDGESDLATVDSILGLRHLTRGALIKVPEQARVQLGILHRKGVLWIHGPAEVEVTEARIVRGGEGGIHNRPTEVHATLRLVSGVLAGAMEGTGSDRPSLEVQTETVLGDVSAFGRWAVVRMTGKEGAEAWIRDGAGADQLKLLLASGAVELPPGGVLFFTPEEPAGPDAIEVADRSFLDEYLNPLAVHVEPSPGLDQLLSEAERRRLR